MYATLYVVARRKKREAADRLASAALAASGDGKAIKKQLKDWSRD